MFSSYKYDISRKMSNKSSLTQYNLCVCTFVYYPTAARVCSQCDSTLRVELADRQANIQTDRQTVVQTAVTDVCMLRSWSAQTAMKF